MKSVSSTVLFHSEQSRATTKKGEMSGTVVPSGASYQYSALSSVLMAPMTSGVLEDALEKNSRRSKCWWLPDEALFHLVFHRITRYFLDLSYDTRLNI